MAREQNDTRCKMKSFPSYSPLRNRDYRELDLDKMSMNDADDRRIIGRRLGLLQSRLRDIEDALQSGRCVTQMGMLMSECHSCCTGQQGHGEDNVKFERDEIRRQLEAIRKFRREYLEKTQAPRWDA